MNLDLTPVVNTVVTILMTALVGGGSFGALGLLWRKRNQRRAARASASSPTASIAMTKLVEDMAERAVLAANSRTEEYARDAKAARTDAREAREEAAAARRESAQLREELGEARALMETITRQNGAQRAHIEVLEREVVARGGAVPEWPSDEELATPILSHDRRTRDVPHDGFERRRSTT